MSTIPWSNFARIIYKRTYSRNDTGRRETWDQTIERVVAANVRGHDVPEQEIKDLLRFGKERKAIPAGRGLWFCGSPAHPKIGGAALVNCWAVEASQWEHFILAQDLLMLGGGVGVSVEHRYVSKLPKIRKGVCITHRAAKDTDFIVPDTREGWCELVRRTLESFFVSGKSFDYSTICIRGAGEPLKGFGGTASGPIPLIKAIENLCSLLIAREGKHIRPIDAADIVTILGEMVVSGNLRRSAIIILGDPWDKEFLQMKRFDLGPLPSYRSCANYSVVCDDMDDVHPLFWKTYESGEAFGIVNRRNIQKYGRMGEAKKDSAYLINPCGEATLEHAESCNLQEIALPNLENEEEFVLAARLMHRYGKRVTMEHFHHPDIQEVVNRNRRVGTGIAGCLISPLFNAKTLDRVYAEIQDENRKYSKELGIPESIRTTVVKPGGTTPKVLDLGGYEGISPAFSRYIIQRVRFDSNDVLIPHLIKAGHHIEPEKRLDGTLNHNTQVANFYIAAPDGGPVADEDFNTWKQLDALKLAQEHWSDQAVSTSVYYDRKDIPKLKGWLYANLDNLKSISFLCLREHGFAQAPKEAITKDEFEKMSAKIKSIEMDDIGDGPMVSTECEGGFCPVR